MDHVTPLEHLLPTFVQTAALACSPSRVISTHQDSLDPPSRTRVSKTWPFALLLFWFRSRRTVKWQFIWPRRCSCLSCDVTRLLGRPLWKTSIWNMSSVPCLLLPFPLSCERALRRLMAFSDGTMCYLLLTTVGLLSTFLISRHLPFPLLFTLLSHLLLPPTFLR